MSYYAIRTVKSIWFRWIFFEFMWNIAYLLSFWSENFIYLLVKSLESDNHRCNWWCIYIIKPLSKRWKRFQLDRSFARISKFVGYKHKLFIRNSLIGTVCDLFGSPGSGSFIHKKTFIILFSRYVKLSKIHFRQNDILSLILCVIVCLHLVRKCHKKHKNVLFS